MKLWWIGGTVVGLLGLSIYLAAVKRPNPIVLESSVRVNVLEAPATPKSLALSLRQDVVDVCEVDSLLDPPAIPLADPGEAVPVITRVGYEEDAAPRQSKADVKPIPNAKD